MHQKDQFLHKRQLSSDFEVHHSRRRQARNKQLLHHNAARAHLSISKCRYTALTSLRVHDTPVVWKVSWPSPLLQMGCLEARLWKCLSWEAQSEISGIQAGSCRLWPVTAEGPWKCAGVPALSESGRSTSGLLQELGL